MLNRKLVKISAHESLLNVSKELGPHWIIVTTPELPIWVWTSLTLFRLGGGLFEPPLRQNRDNSYTERAMTFKFSDFS